MANYPVTITNGAGSANLPAGGYSVTATITGYNGALTPSTYTATTGTGSQAYTLAATGTLTLTVNETGASGGAAITSGTFIRCNLAGDITYGTAKTVSATGICEFDHVPYGTVGSPVVFYVKQLTSDTTHSIQTGVITVNMNSQTMGQYVQNPPAAKQDFTLADQYYSGLNLDGTMDFTGPT